MRDTRDTRRLLTVGTRAHVLLAHVTASVKPEITRCTYLCVVVTTTTVRGNRCRTIAARAYVGHVTIRTVVPSITHTRAAASLPSRLPVDTCDAFCVVRTVDRTAEQRSTI